MHIYKRRSDSAAVIVYESDADHGNKGINVLYADGKDAFLSLNEAHKKIAAAQQSAHK